MTMVVAVIVLHEWVGDRAACDGVLVFEQKAGLLENTFLAGGVHIHQHVAGRQDGGETVHGFDHSRPARIRTGGRRTIKGR